MNQIDASQGRYPTGPANSSTLTKMNFTEVLSDKMGLSRSEANAVVETVFEEILTALVARRDVKLANFGTFSTRDKVARPGRNPKTGVPHVIAARRVVTFLAAPHMRDSVASFKDPEGFEPKV